MVDITDLRMKLYTTGQIADVALMLLENRIVTAEQITNAGVGKPRNVIMALREKLDLLGVEVQSHRRMGYWLEDDAKAKLLQLVGGRETMEVGDEE
jgi:Glu-tRNA(Gln) amidotransferase subunit E-like FAD-binding protein